MFVLSNKLIVSKKHSLGEHYVLYQYLANYQSVYPFSHSNITKDSQLPEMKK